VRYRTPVRIDEVRPEGHETPGSGKLLAAGGQDDVHLQVDEFRREPGQAVILVLRKTILTRCGGADPMSDKRDSVA
jgi:hypothetical protein